MRKSTVRRGIRAICAGVVALIAATFFHGELATFLMLGMDGEARLTFFGFFLAGMLGGFGALVTALGFLQSGSSQPKVRLLPAVIVLFSLIVLFFVLTYTSLTTPTAPRLDPGESINI